MKGIPMKLAGVISTAVLSLTLGAAAPVYAQQDQHDQQEDQKVQPAQDEKKTQPDKPVKPEEKGAQRPETVGQPRRRRLQRPREELVAHILDHDPLRIQRMPLCWRHRSEEHTSELQSLRH